MTLVDFKLKRPCAKCPFRTDVPPYLRRSRAIEIAHSIASGGVFPCHETTIYDEEIEDMREGEGSQFCAGALLVMEHSEAPNQHVRIAERVGVYDAKQMDRGAPVHKSLASFVQHHSEDEEESECCSVVGYNCLAPAGMLVDGHAIQVEAEGEVSECPDCGEPVCENCSNDEGLCEYCAEEA